MRFAPFLQPPLNKELKLLPAAAFIVFSTFILGRILDNKT